MAVTYSLFKFVILFTILLTATAVDLSRNSMMTMGGLPLSISMMKLKLNQNEEETCGRKCSSHAECSDGWICRWCWWHYQLNYDRYDYHCSMLPN
ncbi:hypothetical protein A4A49_21570 [Nicotiana attenuata]|uniref:Carboxypeptidase A inhibitor-like domain-containing protein n=1 Tax=Nicotiana attenuata TaxID=49451 RepID=A0A1J6KBX5_NICAT|nr:hypothetical protein A4A49_21570 [Nicotiana attenuata]